MKALRTSPSLTSANSAHVSHLQRIAIDSIAIGERIGFFNQAHAERIGESMEAEGLHAPIQVKRNGNAAKSSWTLVAGLHRVRGAQFKGWTHIDAIQVADPSATAADLRRLELAENLSHRVRRPIERAIMMAAHAEIEEATAHPANVGETSQERAARMRHDASVTVTDAKGWRERTAEAFDCSLSKLEQHQRLYREIVKAMPDLAQALNDHPLGESFRAMREIAKIDGLSERRAFATLLLSRSDWANIKAVFVAAEIHTSNGRRGQGPVHFGLKLRQAWQALPIDAKRAHFVEMAHDVPPSLVRETIELLRKRLP